MFQRLRFLREDYCGGSFSHARLANQVNLLRVPYYFTTLFFYSRAGGLDITFLEADIFPSGELHILTVLNKKIPLAEERD